jgi:hypothetical protein
MKLNKDAMFGITFISVVVAFFVWIFYDIYQDDKEFNRHESETYSLHAVQLSNETSAHGNFFLIAGGYGKNENAQYYFYVESPDGTLALHKNKYEDLVLKLEPVETKPFIKCSGPNGIIDPNERFEYSGSATKKYCVFHVPENSIKHDYDLDLKNLKE